MTVMKELVWLTQLGFSIISPLLLCILGAVWLQRHFDLGLWVLLLGLALGLGGAFSAGISFYRHTRQLGKPKKKSAPPPISFNEHD